jgi:hypothetical protein
MDAIDFLVKAIESYSGDRSHFRSVLSSADSHDEQMLDLIAQRVATTLNSDTPANSAFMALLQKYQDKSNKKQRLTQLFRELRENIENPDLRFISRYCRSGFVYEMKVYWWKARQFLFKCEEEKTWRHRDTPEWVYQQPEISTDPNNVYLDKLIYSPDHRRFYVEEVPELRKWWEENVDTQKDIFLGWNCSAIPFPDIKAQQLQSLASSNKEWSILGYPDIAKFLARQSRKTVRSLKSCFHTRSILRRRSDMDPLDLSPPCRKETRPKR